MTCGRVAPAVACSSLATVHRHTLACLPCPAAIEMPELLTLYNVSMAAGFKGTLADFIAADSIDLADALPPTSAAFLGGCDTPEATVQGWPAPMCSPAQTARSAGGGAAPDDVDMPLTFNVTDPALKAQLRAAYARIRNTTNAYMHASMFGDALANPVVRNASFAWGMARAHANGMSSMMQLQVSRSIVPRCVRMRSEGAESGAPMWCCCCHCTAYHAPCSTAVGCTARVLVVVA